MLKKVIWCNELENLNINKDLGCGESDVTVLIGADVGLQFETGRIYHLMCGLSAEETRLDRHSRENFQRISVLI